MISTTVFSSLRKNSTTSLRGFIKFYSTEKETVEIPKRIQRGPTDILRALASTVKKDPTAPHFKFHDDPYLIPASNMTKRSYALAMEAGRKAALWVRQEHADLFQHQVADPPIEAFSPKLVYDENSQVTEGDLKKLVSSFNVSDAITVYKLLMKNGADVSRDTQQSLLELLCYYNCEDPLTGEWIEERWFRAGVRKLGGNKKTWHDAGLAWDLFHQIKPRDSKSLSAIISGMAEHGQLDSAWKLFLESKEQGIDLSVSVYNALIAKARFLKESHSQIWELILDILVTMQKLKVKPNLGTLNAALEALNWMTTNKFAIKNAVSTVAEFQSLGIQPSLASYYYILNICSKDKDNLEGVMSDILDRIEGEELKAQDVNDILFFVRAMELCRNPIRSKELCLRLNSILNTGNNYDLIGDSYKESVYHRNFLAILLETETTDEFMRTYNKIVPNVYTPEPSITQMILDSIQLSGDVEFIPKIWADIVAFDQSDRENLIERLLNIMANNFDEKYYQSFANIGWEVWNKIEGDSRERKLLQWTGKMLSDLLMIVHKSGEQIRLNSVFDKLDKGQGVLLGEPDVLAIQLYLDSCISSNLPSRALQVVQYCHSMGFLETDDIARKVNNEIALTESERQTLINIVGEETLQKK